MHKDAHTQGGPVPIDLSTLLDVFASLVADKVEARMRATQAPAPEPQPTGFVSKQEAARELRISTTTLDRLWHEPGFPQHVVGGRRRFDVAELRAWLDARGQRAAQ